MDQIMGKVGGLWLGNNKELNSMSKDVNNAQEKASWLASKVKGSVQKPLPELLQEYDLPAGLFPQDATGYDFDEKTKRLSVDLPSVCEVSYKDSSVLKFSKNVSGYLEKRKMTFVEGMKTRVVIWVKVTTIACEGSKVIFSAGLKKARSRAAYEIQKDGVAADKF